jgi:hypothetical protein
MGSMREWLLRILLKVGWSVGSASDAHDRLRGADAGRFLPHLLPGDFVLLGNAGRLSHVAVHVGAGELVHAMATEKTMRGWLGAMRDAWDRLLGRPDQLVGVVRETLAHFLERYERDTVVVVRPPVVDEATRARGLEHLVGLVGRPYDYGFARHNTAYYCTELVAEYLEATLGDAAPRLTHTRHRVPLLLDEDVIEPIAVLHAPGLVPVAATQSAFAGHAEHLGTAAQV